MRAQRLQGVVRDGEACAGAVDGPGGRPPKLKDTLCHVAGMCLCSQPGKQTVSLRTKLDDYLKAHKGGQRELLVGTEIVILILGTRLAVRGAAGAAAWDALEPPDEARWFLVAHVLQKPWVVTYLEMRVTDRDMDMCGSVQRAETDEGYELAAPAGTLELELEGNVCTKYSAESRWEASTWQLVWSNKLVPTMTPDRCEVRCMNRSLPTFYDPRRHARVPKSDMIDAWAAAAEEEHGDSDEPKDEDKEEEPAEEAARRRRRRGRPR